VKTPPFLPRRVRSLGLAAAVLLALAIPLPSVAASDSVTYTVLVGYSLPEDGVNIDAYFPAQLTVHVGDTVTFKQNAPEIHTVTFLAPSQEKPQFEGPDFPVVDPAIAYPVLPADSLYDGTGYVNSGLMSTDPSFFLPGEQVTSFSLTFTKAGSFPFYCIVHGDPMSGTINVVDPSATISSPEEVDAQAAQAIDDMLTAVPDAIQAANDAVPAPEDNGDGTTTYHVDAGFESGQIGLMSFFPNKLQVHPGDTVIWRLVTVPHTITFLNGDPEPALVVPGAWPPPSGDTATVMFNPAILGPSDNVDQPLNATDVFNSGFLPQPGAEFSLTVGDVSGQIPYICLLHDASGMSGELDVVPSA